MTQPRPLGVAITPLETRRDLVVRLAIRAEELGYAAVYVAEGWGHNAAVLLTEIALKTSRIRIGTGVLNVWGRSPATTAMLATSLGDLAPGRFELGLGAGSPQLAEGLHGVEFRAPVARLRAYTAEVRSLLDGERAHSGVPGCRPMRLAAQPATYIPISLAALGPQAIRLCGEVADIWNPFLLPRSGLAERTRLLDEGVAAVDGRTRPRICPGIPTAVHTDPEQAQAVAAWWITFYLTKMGPLYGQTLRSLGFEEPVDAVVAAAGGGSTGLPEAAQPLVGELTLTGDPDTAADSLDGWYDAGADMPTVVLPPNRDPDDLEQTLYALRPQ